MKEAVSGSLHLKEDFLHSDSILKKRFNADMILNKELNIDEKVKVQLWAESGMPIAINIRL